MRLSLLYIVGAFLAPVLAGMELGHYPRAKQLLRSREVVPSRMKTRELVGGVVDTESFSYDVSNTNILDL